MYELFLTVLLSLKKCEGRRRSGIDVLQSVNKTFCWEKNRMKIGWYADLSKTFLRLLVTNDHDVLRRLLFMCFVINET